MRRVSLVLVALATALLVAPTLAGADGPSGAGLADAGLTQSGRWIVDASGRAVILHGLNQVYKVPPYEPSADGFGDDDAAFLAANGFDAMRVGVIWSAVEPRPGVYDDAYLDSIADTVRTLAAHGIVSLLDFHQDLYNEKFQGEGAPAWAVAGGTDGGLRNPALGFPGNYFANPAENRAWDSFWANKPAGDGVGLQDHLAAAWAHVAQHFRDEPAVFGYELLNEPWPGHVYPSCVLPVIGCPSFDRTLTRFYERVTDRIRTVDPSHTVWIEPNVLFSYGDANHLGTVDDQHIALSFHVYCGTVSLLQRNIGCAQLDASSVGVARRYSVARQVPWLMTEFGATQDLSNLAEVLSLADRNRLGWLEWAYTGNDKTSASPDGQALVLDPSRPPTGDNVLAGKLRTLAEPYPQAVAGTPTSWSFKSGVFQLAYTTARVDGSGRFGAGARTEIAVPAVQFPHGYRVSVIGATVTSAPNTPTLELATLPGATNVQVSVTAS